MYKRARLLVVTALLSSVAVAGCGVSAAGPTPAPVGSATLSTSSTTGSTSKSATPVSTSASSARTPNALAFARCMRDSGVPNFPDPIPGGGFAFNPVGIDRGAPAVRAAQAKCQRFAPQPPGGPTAGSSGPPSAQALAQLRTVARCMREHGISAFPDPQTSAPRRFNPGEYSNITNY
jgi:hypothetical protein